MKSLRELHEDEQREAAWLDSTRRLQAHLDWIAFQIIVAVMAALAFILLLVL